jgi:signal transduction histidine kinase
VTRSAETAVRRLVRSPSARDAAVALAALGATLALLAHQGGAGRGLDGIGVALAALASLPLLAWRRSPLAVFALTTAASATLNALDYELGPPFGPTIALFFVATDERSRTRVARTSAVVLGLFAAHVGSAAVAHDGFPTSPILFGVLVWGGAWVLGDQLRERRRRLAHVIRLAAAEERTRIARDLHDSAAHAINVILVQAGAARLLQDRDPEAVTRSLATIEDVARETIGEIDRLVRALRSDGSRSGPEHEIEPPVGLAALETLVERHRAAGLAVELHVDGRRRALPPRVDQAAYRILQESLTNAARHGRGRADVAIDYVDDRLELAISNATAPGANGDPVAAGHGILGMRERTALLGGSLETARSGGRFRVHATLPTTPVESG